MQNRILSRMFWMLNKFFMVPMFRLGFGPLMGNPFTGYIMVVKTIGRKTGKVRFTPVNYTIQDGKVYCLAGFGKRSHWYRNLTADPNVELIMPGGSISGLAENVTDGQEWVGVFRQTLKNGGFAGFMLGFNPHTAPDDVLREKGEGYPMVRVQPTGIGIGASDAGGWMWIWVWVLFIVLLILVLSEQFQ